jgi:hypothetical protein
MKTKKLPEFDAAVQFDDRVSNKFCSAGPAHLWLGFSGCFRFHVGRQQLEDVAVQIPNGSLEIEIR